MFDASTAILLAKVTLLRTLAGRWKITITPAVKAEIFMKETSEDAQIISKLLQEKMISEVKISSSTAFRAEFGLGAGEAEAVQLSAQGGYLLATDDGKAIKTAKILGIPFITAIHCLIHLHKNKVIDTKMALEKLKNLERYGRYNLEIIKDATTMIEGNKNGQ